MSHKRRDKEKRKRSMFSKLNSYFEEIASDLIDEDALSEYLEELDSKGSLDIFKDELINVENFLFKDKVKGDYSIFISTDIFNAYILSFLNIFDITTISPIFSGVLIERSDEMIPWLITDPQNYDIIKIENYYGFKDINTFNSIVEDLIDTDIAEKLVIFYLCDLANNLFTEKEGMSTPEDFYEAKAIMEYCVYDYQGEDEAAIYVPGKTEEDGKMTTIKFLNKEKYDKYSLLDKEFEYDEEDFEDE